MKYTPINSKHETPRKNKKKAVREKKKRLKVQEKHREAVKLVSGARTGKHKRKLIRQQNRAASNKVQKEKHQQEQEAGTRELHMQDAKPVAGSDSQDGTDE